MTHGQCPLYMLIYLPTVLVHYYEAVNYCKIHYFSIVEPYIIVSVPRSHRKFKVLGLCHFYLIKFNVVSL